MTGRTVCSICIAATLRIARNLRGIARRSHLVESLWIRPRPDPVHKHIDLFVGEHPARSLRERGHCSSAHSVGNRVANCGVVGNCEKNGICQSDGCSTFAVRTVASGAVLTVEQIKIYDLVWRENVGILTWATRRTTAGRGQEGDHRGNENRLKLHGRRSFPLFSSIAPGASI